MLSFLRKVFTRPSPPSGRAPVAQRLGQELSGLADALRDHDAHWAKVLGALAVEASTSNILRHSFGLRVRGLFGGMGSFNDVPLPDDLRRKSEQLFTTVEEYLREAWRVRGGEWNTIPEGTLFAKDDVVEIVAGAQIAVDAQGRPQYQQKSEGPFTILRLLEPDMTNMPVYLLGRQSERGWENRFVRHTALRKVAL